MLRVHSHRSHSQRISRGGALVEFMIMLPILLLVSLGCIQWALIYQSKNTVNHAAFMAARAGAVENAKQDAIFGAFARSMSPLYSPDKQQVRQFGTDVEAVNRARADLIQFTRMRILNPTREAFDDFDVNGQGQRIPNGRLHMQASGIGSMSGVSIQDANLLKIEMTVGVRLRVPFINWVISRAGARVASDPYKQQLLRAGRIPIVVTATTRMQSDPILNSAVQSKSEVENGLSTTGRIDGAVASVNGNRAWQSAPTGGYQGGGWEIIPWPIDGWEPGDGSGDPGTGDPGTDPGTDPGEPTDLDCALNPSLPGCTNECPPFTSCGGVDIGEPNVCTAASIDPVDPGITPFDPINPIIDPIINPGGPLPKTSVPSAGTSQPLNLPSLMVGNPIHVMNGNKYQKETDLRALSGVLGLRFERHYNSQAVSNVLVLGSEIGANWRHTYQVTLQEVKGSKPKRLRLIQADGRSIDFTQSSTNTQLFTTRLSQDGSVHQHSNGNYDWRQNATNHLEFNAQGYLSKIHVNEQSVHLSYDGESRQLLAVTDPQGRRLSFSYYPNGRIQSMRDPGGVVTEYRYGKMGNLETVIYAQGTVEEVSKVYHYENTAYPNHLTGITDENEQRFATYAYDEYGRAILSTHANDVNKVTIKYHNASKIKKQRNSKGQLQYVYTQKTDVTDSLGRTSTYHAEVINGIGRITQIEGPGCDSCSVNTAGNGDVKYQYNENNQLTKIEQADGSATIHSYDALGRHLKTELVNTAGEKSLLALFEYTGNSSRLIKVSRPSVKHDALRTALLNYAEDGSVMSVELTGYAPTSDGKFEQTHLVQRANVYAAEIDSSDQAQLILDSNAYGEISKMLIGADDSGLDISYTARGTVQSIVSEKGRIEYEYLPNGLLQSFKSPGISVQWDYDAAKRLVSKSAKTGKGVIEQRYKRNTENQLLEQVWLLNGEAISTLYYDYDNRQRLVALRNQSNDVVKRYDYQADGRVIATDMRDASVLKAGLLKRGQSPHAQIQQEVLQHASLNADLKITAVQDKNENLTKYGRDDFGRIVYIDSPDTGITTYTYTPEGKLKTKTNALGNSVEISYDQNGKLSKAELNDEIQQYDWTDASDRKRLASIDAGSIKESRTYNEQGLLVSLSRTIGNSTYVTHYHYDKTNKLIAKTLPDGQRIKYVLSDNRLASIKRDNPMFIDTAVVDFIDTERAGYQEWQSGNGINTKVAYHGDPKKEGHLARLQIGDLHDFQYTHDHLAGSRNRIIGINDGDAIYQRYRYDEQGRLDFAITPRGLYGYQYDANGNRTRKVINGISADYRYASDSNRLDQTGVMLKWVPASAGMTVGEENKVVISNSAAITRQDSDRGSYSPVSSSQISTSSSQISASSSQISASSLRRQGSHSTETPAVAGGKQNEALSTAQWIQATNLENATLKFEPTYLATGEVSTYGPYRFEYNSNGQPLEVYWNDKLLAEYQYNSRAERVAKTLYNAQGSEIETTHYLYENKRLVSEVTYPKVETGKLQVSTSSLVSGFKSVIPRLDRGTHPAINQKNYIYHQGTLVSILHGKQIYAVHTNHLGSPIAVTDKKQNVIWQADYAPYGRAFVDSDPDQDGRHFELNVRLPGQYADKETGLHYNYYRFYDPDSGRYLQSDPMGLNAGLNTYAYVSGDPINHVDPLGLLLFAFDGTGNTDHEGDLAEMGNALSNVVKFRNAYQGDSNEIAIDPNIINHADGSTIESWQSNSFYITGAGMNDRRSGYISGPISDLPLTDTDLNHDLAEGLSMFARVEIMAQYLMNYIDQINNTENVNNHTIEIDITGFSRGAAEARLFANVVDAFSRGDFDAAEDMLAQGDIDQRLRIGLAYRLDREKAEEIYSKMVCQNNNLNIRFMGLFDTVPHYKFVQDDDRDQMELGIPTSADYVAHAVAATEDRHDFGAISIHNRAETGNTSPSFNDDGSINLDSYDPVRIEQGFIGAHSDIGGGYKDGDLSDVALMWMIRQAENAGAQINHGYLNSERYNIVTNPIIHSSVGVFPFLIADREFEYMNGDFTDQIGDDNNQLAWNSNGDYGMNASLATNFYDDRYRETIFGFGILGSGDCPVGSDVIPGLLEACRVNGMERGDDEDTNYRTLVGAVSTDYEQWLKDNYKLSIDINHSQLYPTN